MILSLQKIYNPRGNKTLSTILFDNEKSFDNVYILPILEK